MGEAASRSIAVVSGATGTLGSQVCAALVDRGLAVVAVSRSGAEPCAGVAAGVAADLATEASVSAVRAALPDGQVQMIVHAVGLPGSPGVLDVDPEQLGYAVSLKAGGLLRLLHAGEGRLGEGSRVVAVGGHLGAEPTEHAPLAGVANAALANLVRQLVGPLGRLGASVHLLAPGPFDSPRVQRLIEAKADGKGVSPDEERRALLAEYPQGRMPVAADIAWAVTMLLDPSASAMTGSTLFLDGGIRRGIF
jgi:NAD(P)-dependent dehydrogenase (short-subunit alcohol dehydrogenase family)